MTPDFVADVGNTRIKWGRCSGGAVAAVSGLPPDDPGAWEVQAAAWELSRSSSWAVSGVHPERRNRLATWLRTRGSTIRLIERAAELPLRVALEYPDYVGIDRLLDAVAANARRRPHTPAVLVDAGSAVTVDYLDAAGSFLGGAIFPGFRLMTKALHDYTALLPLVEVREPAPPLGASTPTAIHAGVYWSVLGGVEALVRNLTERAATIPQVFFTGGDAAVLAAGATVPVCVWPEMTLEGVRLSAEALPG